MLHSGLEQPFITPPIYSHHRELFEDYAHRNDMSFLRYISIGAQIELAQRNLANESHTPNEVIERYHDKYGWLEDYCTTQIDAIEHDPGRGYGTLYRTKLLGAILDQMVCIPSIQGFHPHHTFALRKQLLDTDGIYGSIAGVMEEALQKLPTLTGADQKNGIGWLNEITPIALINRSQHPDIIALPALPHADIQRGIDMVASRTIRGKRPNFYAAQVKSYEADVVMPDKAIHIIGGIALGNSTRSPYWEKPDLLRTAHAIVAEANGTSSDADEHVLGIIEHDLKMAVSRNYDFIHIPEAPEMPETS